MNRNKLVASEKEAARLLLEGNTAAQIIPDNEPKLYVVDDVLHVYGLSPKTFTVWAVKTGENSYAGILINSGIVDENGKLVGAVRVSFADMNIVKMIEPRQFATPYIQAFADSTGSIILIPRLAVIDSLAAKELLLKKFPEEAKGKTVVMFRANRTILKRYRCNSFWGIKTRDGYLSVNPYSGALRLITSQNVIGEMVPGERVDRHYRLIQKAGRRPRLLLWRIKKEVR